MQQYTEGQMSLPNDLSEANEIIAGMDIGDTGYVVPWAMCADEEGKLWLNTHHIVHSQPIGDTVQMGIRRLSDGFMVDLSHPFVSKYRWSKQTRSMLTHRYEPVVDMIR